jgi:hypothetical protein
MTTFFVVFAGLLIRFGLPVLLMVGLVSLLRRLDARWQKEALTQQKLAAGDSGKHALDLSACAVDGISHTQSIQASEPCWQVFRKSNGYLHEECLHCKVFRAAPILIPNN